MAAAKPENAKVDLAPSSVPLGIMFVQEPTKGRLVVMKLNKCCRVPTELHDIIVGIVRDGKFIRFWREPDKPNGDILIAANEDNVLERIYVKRNKEFKCLFVFKTPELFRNAKVSEEARDYWHPLAKLQIQIWEEEEQGNRWKAAYLKSRYRIEEKKLPCIDENHMSK